MVDNPFLFLLTSPDPQLFDEGYLLAMHQITTQHEQD
jgi:hypothetical protein